MATRTRTAQPPKAPETTQQQELPEPQDGAAQQTAAGSEEDPLEQVRVPIRRGKEYAIVGYEPDKGYTKEQVQTLKDMLQPKLTDNELKMFLGVAIRRRLDPFTGQIYPVKRYNSQLDTDVMKIQTGIDGFRLIAERSNDYRGQEDPQWCGPDGQWVDIWLAKEPPAAARVGVLRGVFSQPMRAIAKYESYVQKDRKGNVTLMWQKMAAEQLAKCAESLALRKAFPEELSGLHTADEMAQAEVIDITPVQSTTTQQGERQEAPPPAGAPAPPGEAPPLSAEQKKQAQQVIWDRLQALVGSVIHVKVNGRIVEGKAERVELFESVPHIVVRSLKTNHLKLFAEEDIAPAPPVEAPASAVIEGKPVALAPSMIRVFARNREVWKFDEEGLKGWIHKTASVEHARDVQEVHAKLLYDLLERAFTTHDAVMKKPEAERGEYAGYWKPVYDEIRMFANAKKEAGDVPAST